jgi:predicted  nucleic acid-binding Zn-ribbon protein
MADCYEDSELRSLLVNKDFELDRCSQQINALTNTLLQQRADSRRLSAQLEVQLMSKSNASSPRVKSFTSHELLETLCTCLKQSSPSRDSVGSFESLRRRKASESPDYLEHALYRLNTLQKKVDLVLRENEGLKESCAALEDELTRLRSPRGRQSSREASLAKQVMDLTAKLAEREAWASQLELRLRELESPRGTSSGLVIEMCRVANSDDGSIEDRISLLEHKANLMDSSSSVISRPGPWQVTLRSTPPSLTSSSASSVRHPQTSMTEVLKDMEAKSSAVSELQAKYAELLDKYRELANDQSAHLTAATQQSFGSRTSEGQDSHGNSGTEGEHWDIHLKTELLKRGLLAPSRRRVEFR